RRALSEDKDARQALTLAILRGDNRAKDARTQAYEDRLAESLIKRINNGDKGAKDELTKQAMSGNEKARLYLGLDKPEASADSISASAAVAVTLTPQATANALSASTTPSAVSGTGGSK
ncbi:MAG TPA: hypothetical protein VK786_07495, partial [bacterium]|nr:hypothetical protein [bacterium]